MHVGMVVCNLKDSFNIMLSLQSLFIFFGFIGRKATFLLALIISMKLRMQNT